MLRKVFLYLYPIKKYSSRLIEPNEYYKSKGWSKPFDVLNECIQKRYRDNGYEVIFVKYPNEEIYGIELKDNDKVINTDVIFNDVNCFGESKKDKSIDIFKYPSEYEICRAIGMVDKIVIGGYHYSDCVKRVGEYFFEKGVDTLVDLELTDLFFNLYMEEYFDINKYSPSAYRNYRLSKYPSNELNFAEELFEERYNSPVYHFESNDILNDTLDQKHK